MILGKHLWKRVPFVIKDILSRNEQQQDWFEPESRHVLEIIRGRRSGCSLTLLLLLLFCLFVLSFFFVSPLPLSISSWKPDKRTNPTRLRGDFRKQPWRWRREPSTFWRLFIYHITSSSSYSSFCLFKMSLWENEPQRKQYTCENRMITSRSFRNASAWLSCKLSLTPDLTFWLSSSCRNLKKRF